MRRGEARGTIYAMRWVFVVVGLAIAFEFAGLSHLWREPLLGIPVWGWVVLAVARLSRPWSSSFAAMGGAILEISGRVQKLEEEVDEGGDEND